MRCAERAFLPARQRKSLVTHRLHGRGLDGFGIGHARQDAGQSAGEHGLAGAGRADEQQAVAAGRGDFERAFGVLLAAHFAQVRTGVFRWQRRKPVHRQQRRTMQVSGDIEQVGGGVNTGAFRKHGFVGVGCWKYQRALRVACRERRGKRAAHGAQLSGERQLADEFDIIQCRCRDLAGSGEDTDCDRQIETPAFLGQIGGCEVDGDAARGKLELGSEQGAAHPVAAFFYLGSGRPTMESPGRPLDRCTSTVTAGASMPARARLCTTASDMESFPCALVIYFLSSAFSSSATCFRVLPGARGARQHRGLHLQLFARDEIELGQRRGQRRTQFFSTSWASPPGTARRSESSTCSIFCGLITGLLRRMSVTEATQTRPITSGILLWESREVRRECSCSVGPCR